MKYDVICPEVQLVSSYDAMTRKYRLDPSQYNVETERIVRSCKERHLKLASLNDLKCIDEVYLPNRFSRKYTKNAQEGVPMIGTSSMLNLKLPNDDRIFINDLKSPLDLYVRDGDILVSRSGTVGITVLCGKSYERFVASDHCIRVRIDKKYRGYVAAYLMSDLGQALLTKNSHGKVIKELVPEDIIHLPIMIFSPKDIEQINLKILRSVEVYDECREILEKVEQLLDKSIGHLKSGQSPELLSGIISFSDLIQSRLDPHLYDPHARYLTKQIEKGEHKRLGDCVDIWGVPRFKRHYLDAKNDNGIGLFSSSDIVRAYLSPSKFISKKMNSQNIEACIIEKGTILIPCSGTYGGILGRGVLAGKVLDGQAVTQHVLRMTKKNDLLNYNYVAAFICSSNYGYPLITSRRFGKDIPEIAPESLKDIPVPIIHEEIQKSIGDLFSKANELLDEANDLEHQAVAQVENLYFNYGVE